MSSLSTYLPVVSPRVFCCLRMIFGTEPPNDVEKFMERTRQKAFDLLRKEFGSTARFEIGYRPVIDFFWRRARLAMAISGPLRPRLFSDGPMMQDKAPDLDFSRWMMMLPRFPKTGVVLVAVPHYMVWHRPQHFLAETRMMLLNSKTYPRLNAKAVGG
jgi:hypothetical protein